MFLLLKLVSKLQHLVKKIPFFLKMETKRILDLREPPASFPDYWIFIFSEKTQKTSALYFSRTAICTLYCLPFNTWSQLKVVGFFKFVRSFVITVKTLTHWRPMYLIIYRNLLIDLQFKWMGLVSLWCGTLIVNGLMG